MDRFLYYPALALIRFIQALPLTWVARAGRLLGSLAYYLDARHRQVALANLQAAFGQERSPKEILSLAREHYRRLGENYGCAIKTAAMTDQQLTRHLEVAGVDLVRQAGSPNGCRIAAIGHFGNFELYARLHPWMPEYQLATTYRALNQPAFDRLLHQLRSRSGCLFFERRRQARALQEAFHQHRILLGLLVDQHAGNGGAWLPFFGRICSTNPSPAILALRYRVPLLVGICFRTGLARWRVEFTHSIPTIQQGRRRTIEAIMAEVNAAFEEAVRRDPPNWFWVHNRWKPRRPSRRSSQITTPNTGAHP